MFFPPRSYSAIFQGAPLSEDFWESNQHVWSEFLLLPTFTEEDLSLMQGSTGRSCTTARALLVRAGFLGSENT